MPNALPFIFPQPIIDTSISEPAGAPEAVIREDVEDAIVSGVEETPGGVELAKGNAKRAPSSDSQDSGVGQEDESKSEDLGKSSGLQGKSLGRAASEICLLLWNSMSVNPATKEENFEPMKLCCLWMVFM